MEGPHLLAALLDAQVMPREVYYQPDLLQRTAQGRSLLDRLLYASSLTPQQLIEVSERVIEGNMGTILRTALAADVAGVLLTPGCVDCYSPKVVRAASGAHIALPIEMNLSWDVIAEKIALHCKGERRVFLADAGSSHLYFEQDLKQPLELIKCNDSNCPSQEARNVATLPIAVPLANGVESLNAAMATGIGLFEAIRQALQS